MSFQSIRVDQVVDNGCAARLACETPEKGLEVSDFREPRSRRSQISEIWDLSDLGDLGSLGPRRSGISQISEIRARDLEARPPPIQGPVAISQHFRGTIPQACQILYEQGRRAQRPRQFFSRAQAFSRLSVLHRFNELFVFLGSNELKIMDQIPPTFDVKIQKIGRPKSDVGAHTNRGEIFCHRIPRQVRDSPNRILAGGVCFQNPNHGLGVEKFLTSQILGELPRRLPHPP